MTKQNCKMVKIDMGQDPYFSPFQVAINVTKNDALNIFALFSSFTWGLAMAQEHNVVERNSCITTFRQVLE